MKKNIVLIFCVVISIFASLTYRMDTFLNDSKNLISILLTILGLCFTGVSFMSSSITDILKKHNYNKIIAKNSNDIINSIEDDIMLILYLTIILIIANLFLYIDIPIIINPKNINFGIFYIISFKQSIINFVFSLSFCLSFYSFYDLIKATFSLLKDCYNDDKNA